MHLTRPKNQDEFGARGPTLLLQQGFVEEHFEKINFADKRKVTQETEKTKQEKNPHANYIQKGSAMDGDQSQDLHVLKGQC